MDTCVISVIQTYLRRLNSKPYVPSTMFGCATLGANGVAIKLFISFLFSDPIVGVQLFKDIGLSTAVWPALSAGYKCPGASILIVRTITDGGIGGSYLLPRQSGSVHGFGSVRKFNEGFVNQVHHSLRSCSHFLTRPSVSLHTRPTSRACRNVTPLHPTPQICSVTAKNTSACDEYITTDDVRRLFVVLCASHEAKLSNYSTTFEWSSHVTGFPCR